jgi:hypothetical protein
LLGPAAGFIVLFGTIQQGAKRPGAIIEILVDGKSEARIERDSPVRGRGNAYIGRAGIAPLVDDDNGPVIPAKCSCDIASVTVKKNAAD